MTILNANGEIIPDLWSRVGDDSPIPDDGPVIITPTRFAAEAKALSGRNAPLGLHIEPDAFPGDGVADFNRFDILCLSFPKFTDGRSYSHARRLRDSNAFNGELRAVGNVLRDQLLYMKRCGFDSFALPEGANAADWARGLGDFSLAYQPAAGQLPVAAQLRTRNSGQCATFASPGVAGSWSY